MKTRTWHIKIEFDWESLDIVDLRQVKIMLGDLLPTHWKNIKTEIVEKT